MAKETREVINRRCPICKSEFSYRKRRGRPQEYCMDKHQGRPCDEYVKWQAQLGRWGGRIIREADNPHRAKLAMKYDLRTLVSELEDR